MRPGSFSQTMIRCGFFSITQSRVHIPVGSADDEDSVLIGDLRDARRPVAGGKDITHQQRLPVGHAVRGSCSARYRQTAPAHIRPARRQCGSRVPSRRFCRCSCSHSPFLQKKHSPQKVSTLTVTRSPGLWVTAAPTASTMPTISWPTVMPGTARAHCRA